MPTAPPAWANKIVGHEVIPAGQLLAHPDNFRLHTQMQKAAIRGSLDEIGWVDEVKVSQRSGRIVDGHLRVSEALGTPLGELEPVPCALLDLTEAEERAALIFYDAITGLAVLDLPKRAALAAEVETGDAALLDMLASMALTPPPAPGPRRGTAVVDAPPLPLEGSVTSRQVVLRYPIHDYHRLVAALSWLAGPEQLAAASPAEVVKLLTQDALLARGGPVWDGLRPDPLADEVPS